MNIKRIKKEITIDPKARNYAQKTAVEILADGKVKYIKRDKTSLTGSEILNAIPKAVFFALSVDDKEQVWNVVHIAGGINPFGLEADILIEVFGQGSVTITALAALRFEMISRWDDLGLK